MPRRLSPAVLAFTVRRPRGVLDVVRDLPDIQGAPFDRMLVAQALVEDLVIASADPVLRRYEVAVVCD